MRSRARPAEKDIALIRHSGEMPVGRVEEVIEKRAKFDIRPGQDDGLPVGTPQLLTPGAGVIGQLDRGGLGEGLHRRRVTQEDKGKPRAGNEERPALPLIEEVERSAQIPRASEAAIEGCHLDDGEGADAQRRESNQTESQPPPETRSDLPGEKEKRGQDTAHDETFAKCDGRHENSQTGRTTDLPEHRGDTIQ